ncbi:MAG: 4Fe-4S dicluster domain-containing protein, partial [Verrucomicrobiales bacterium]|nr:4Fe-4S dicluster domain-containing protein [Verrucomicrobiales bacterium]
MSQPPAPRENPHSVEGSKTPLTRPEATLSPSDGERDGVRGFRSIFMARWRKKDIATLPAMFLDETKSLACVHCGLCLGACPTYLETGNENDSPRGRIYIMRALQAGRLSLSDASVRHIDLCLGCRACESACPSGVQYGALLETTRSHIEHNYQRSLFQTFLRRVAIEKVFPFPWRMKLALQPAKALKRLRMERLLPKFVRDAFELIPDHSSAVTLPELSPASAGSVKRGRVGFISGCVMSVMFGSTNRASVRLLNRIGYDVVTPRSQICCGALFAHGGNLARARAFARRNIEAFARLDLDAIIINAAGCGSTLKEYGHLLEGDPVWASRGQAFGAQVRDLTEFLASHAESPLCEPQSADILAAAGVTHAKRPATKQLAPLQRVTYHDACH